ncbi:hypothetical protein BSR09_00725 [Stutzerimonas degradans]|nr:hypothetical protein BSR09_00725 [Stutzerimonas degradans]
MNEQGLKALENLGAELGAVKAENEAMRKVLSQAYSALYDWAPRSGKEMRAKNCCVLLLMDALSQQAEPSTAEAYTALDMASQSAQAFRDGMEAAKAEPAPAQDERDAGA